MSIIKKERVTLAPFVPDAPVEGHTEKQVRVLKRDGIVFAVELTCSCGELSVVELSLDETPPPVPETPLPTEETSDE